MLLSFLKRGRDGQTTEVLSYPAEAVATEQIVGAPLKLHQRELDALFQEIDPPSQASRETLIKPQF